MQMAEVQSTVTQTRFACSIVDIMCAIALSDRCAQNGRVSDTPYLALEAETGMAESLRQGRK